MRVFVGLIVGMAGLSSVLAAADPSLVGDKKYAWPRERELALSGAWQLASGDAAQTNTVLPDLARLDWFETTVPTDVHWALVRAGKAANPYAGLHSKDLRWVEDKAWYFRKTFSVDKTFRSENLRLLFEGVDYYGHYWLNGRYLGHSEGAFGAVKINVGGLRYDAPNELIVRVDCGGYKAGRKAGGAAPWASLVKSELWSGWQVGAADFNTVGLWQPVRLVANDWPCLERPFVRTLALAGDAARVGLTVEVCTARPAETPCEVQVTVRGCGFDAPPCAGRVGVHPLDGTVLADVEVTVPQPRLWWPVGLGAQPLYEAEVCLVRDGKTLDRLTVPFGVRTVERRSGPRQRTSYDEKAWIFYVNGKPLFVKGANWMPIDALADVSPSHYARQLELVRNAGVQMLRVWGGGIVETDAFYEQCDRLGVMVWQEFPLTCGWRADKVNRKVWEDTVAWQVFRLRNHPSLVFWCGGNEFNPDDRANADLVGAAARAVRVLDGTRPFMAASPDEGDIHGYPQWDASYAWRSELTHGPFISEWGTHAMPTPQTYRDLLSPREADAVVGPTLLKMDKKAMAADFPEVMHHWVEFQPDRLVQMLARGSAFDDLSSAPLGRFSEAVAAGAAEFYRYSCEAARTGYPQNGGLLLWVWKRPWPNAGIQLVDGLGRPLAVYYEVRRAFGSPWPCAQPPYLNYVPGDRVELPLAVLSEAAQPAPKGLRMTARLLGPDLRERRVWRDLPPFDGTEGAEACKGPSVSFEVPAEFARAFFFVALDLSDAAGHPKARNVYAFRCPPQLEDAAFRTAYRAQNSRGLLLDKGPWMRPQVEKAPTTLSCRVLAVEREPATQVRVRAEVRNAGALPAVNVCVEAEGAVADDAYFWLEPGEVKTVTLDALTSSGASAEALRVSATAWNAPRAEALTRGR
jgi:beta-mannosidase